MAKNVLIVNCYFDETRLPVARSRKAPQAMAPVFLAGAFDRERCDVRVYSEQYSGPLEDPRLLGWADLLVLTGLTTALDRMLHLTAYARSLNPAVVVAAGGYAVSALPNLCRRYFDYCCLGGVEEIRSVVVEEWGEEFVAERMLPAYDLAPWRGGRVGYAESSRHCNFRCSFCALTGAGRGHENYSLRDIEDQILALGGCDYLSFLDNNFYGPDRRHFADKVELIGDLCRRGRAKGWMALVTSDFFTDDRNLDLVRRNGCKVLFSGIESFDQAWLSSANKRQNRQERGIDLIRKTLDAGIFLLYGLVFDVTKRRVCDIRSEVETILAHPEISLPSYISASIPMLGTPFFAECLSAGRLLPSTRVRDLDGATLSLQPRDSIAEYVEFARGLQHLGAYRGAAMRHTAGFLRRYRRRLDSAQLALALINAAILCAPVAATVPRLWRGQKRERTFVSTTEPLDAVYRPAMGVDPRYADHFEPTMLTDARGELDAALVDDVGMCYRSLAS